jgi:hypothetical protein
MDPRIRPATVRREVLAKASGGWSLCKQSWSRLPPDVVRPLNHCHPERGEGRVPGMGVTRR